MDDEIRLHAPLLFEHLEFLPCHPRNPQVRKTADKVVLIPMPTVAQFLAPIRRVAHPEMVSNEALEILSSTQARIPKVDPPLSIRRWG